MVALSSIVKLVRDGVHISFGGDDPGSALFQSDSAYACIRELGELVSVCVHVCVCMWCVRVCVYVFVCVVCECVCACVCVLCICVCVCVCVCVCACVVCVRVCVWNNHESIYGIRLTTCLSFSTTFIFIIIYLPDVTCLVQGKIQFKDVSTLDARVCRFVAICVTSLLIWFNRG